MPSLFKRMYVAAHNYHGRIKLAIVLQFFDSMLAFIPVGILMYFIMLYLNNGIDSNTPLILFGMLVAGVVIRSLVRYQIDVNEYATMYKVAYSLTSI